MAKNWAVKFTVHAIEFDTHAWARNLPHYFMILRLCFLVRGCLLAPAHVPFPNHADCFITTSRDLYSMLAVVTTSGVFSTLFFALWRLSFKLQFVWSYKLLRVCVPLAKVGPKIVLVAYLVLKLIVYERSNHEYVKLTLLGAEVALQSKGGYKSTLAGVLKVY